MHGVAMTRASPRTDLSEASIKFITFEYPEDLHQFRDFYITRYQMDSLVCMVINLDRKLSVKVACFLRVKQAEWK